MRFFQSLLLAMVVSIPFTTQAEEPVDILYQDAPTTQGADPAFDHIIGTLQSNAQSWDQTDPAAPDYDAPVSQLRSRYAGMISYGDRIASRGSGPAWSGLRTIMSDAVDVLSLAEAHDADIDLRERWFVQTTRAHLAAGHALVGTIANQ